MTYCYKLLTFWLRHFRLSIVKSDQGQHPLVQVRHLRRTSVSHSSWQEVRRDCSCKGFQSKFNVNLVSQVADDQKLRGMALKCSKSTKAFQEKYIFSSLLHQKGTSATQAALLIPPQLASPWIRDQTPQISSGGSCWMTRSTLTSCSLTSPPTSCWQRATHCSPQRWGL